MYKKIKEYLVLFIILIFFFILFFKKKLVCIFNQLTGLWCPGCGITRMIFAIFELDFYKAYRYNPLVFMLIILFILYIVYSLIKYRKIKRVNNKVVFFLLIITILFGIIRNMPLFRFLAPIIE